ncbi:ThuA domain-containing protein [Mucilaginibacter sp. SG564]|uniref:ThuA domain-containing protein n=1 Tax=unclassified Mucilaginibacter TaxID=2617802 RepID=UPI00155419C6|nr:ThuA domain-containing protein [Mucilaginibacter sp. SG564]NOW94383.1 glucose/arabinose dehydrogenase/cytochrome c551/c552/type 1 glutamine amidotransferase [Mucilaginibacter sp. SG564]
MKKILLLFLTACCCITYLAFNIAGRGKPRVLIFSKTMGYHHASIDAGIAAVQKLGSENGFDVDTTKDAGMFTDENLKKYATVIFLSTTGDVLNYRQEAAFERYIQAGGGYVGVHAATDTEYDWGWYGRLAGAWFYDHPGIHDKSPNVQPGVLNVVDNNNAATKHLPKVWKHTDEFYSFKKALAPDVHVLVTIDESSYTGGKRMGYHPMVWYHDFDGGRAFYTELGHTEETYKDADYLKMLLGGIKYAIGDNKDLNYSKVKTQLPPDEDRFRKTQLSTGKFYEPTEMTILPNFDILVLQRRGEIMLYNHSTQKVKQVGAFDVYYKTLHTPGVNAEEGMLGLAKDPNFAKNHWIYIYYSPADSSVNRLSRFTFEGDTITKKTEKVILEVKAQREICCHTGGSIAFGPGPDKILFFSAGDNSTPFDEKKQKYVTSGYAPLDDRPGHYQFDARRSAGNTNDLRGKIMRIKINDDGTYDIPKGNLFPKGTPKTRPEIYVMGDRNPYRISVDQKNGNLYWGEVGPDAHNDSLDTRGPMGYDEVNQARKAGNYGWPYFVADNKPYHVYDYATGTSGAAFDPEHPVNESRNNTGLRDLPPAQPAFIWYPYGASAEFPQVGTGGRNAMAGPVYYTDMYPDSTRLPDYYNGKFLAYEWMRGWIKAVSMTPEGDFDKMEPFFPKLKSNSMIDMEVGPDGRLYGLEYGSGWFSKNPDAGLFRIDYISGNRPPSIALVKANKTSGNLPFVVKLSAKATDPEGDNITYSWNLGNGVTKETTTPELNYTYTKAGSYNITVTAKDVHGAKTKSTPINVYAGNEEPQVTVKFTGGNKSFYLPGVPVKYAVKVTDGTKTASVDRSRILVAVDYIDDYKKPVSATQLEQTTPENSGKAIMLSMDCKSCHKEVGKSIGPSFTEVSAKYKKDPKAMNKLIQKVIKGGAGVWGEVPMSAHPSIKKADVEQIITWVLSINNQGNKKKSLPAEGSILPKPGSKQSNATMVLSAAYTDNGGKNIKALTGRGVATLKSSNYQFAGNEKVSGFTSFKYNGINLLIIPQNGGWFEVDDIDLTGVRSVNMTNFWQAPPSTSLDFEARLDAPDGELVGKGSMPVPTADQKAGLTHVTINPVTDGKMHKLYFIYKPVKQVALVAGVTGLQFNAK